jgi:phage-related tail protein
MSSHALAFMEHLLALDIELGDQDSVAKFLAALKTELTKEKATREKAQVENKTLARVVEDLKKSAHGFTAQVADLEEKNKTSGQQGPGRAY